MSTSIQQSTRLFNPTPRRAGQRPVQSRMAGKQRQSMTIETALDEIGSGWREKFTANQTLTPGEVVAFARAIGLTAEGRGATTRRRASVRSSVGTARCG